MDELNHSLTPEAKCFIEEWNDETTDFIEAHTSGSTGKPKQIHLPKEMVARSAIRSIKHFGITPQSRLHLALSPDYIAGKMLIVRALLAGCRLTAEQPSQTPLATDTDPTPIQLLSLVGAQLPGFCESMRRPMAPRVRHLLLGGAPLNDSMRRLALSGDWTPWESYGMTETASHIALRRITADNSLPFETLPGISVTLNEDECLVIDLGEDGIFSTNDVAELTDSRHFRILGRKDNVIITGGLKVFPEQIEALIAPAMPDGRRYFITSRPSERWGQELILVVEGEPCPLPDLHKLGLGHHQIPRDIIFQSKLSLTSSGKIIRRLPGE